MIGQNKLTINQATMLQAINQWLGKAYSDAYRPRCIKVETKIMGGRTHFELTVDRPSKPLSADKI